MDYVSNRETCLIIRPSLRGKGEKILDGGGGRGVFRFSLPPFPQKHLVLRLLGNRPSLDKEICLERSSDRVTGNEAF